MRSALTLFIGLTVGIAGTVLFRQSMPQPAGSAEAQIAKLEVALKRSENKVAALGGADGRGKSARGPTLQDGLRRIAEDIRAGQPVTPDDIFEVTKPLIRDLSPLFDRIRTKELQRESDTMAGELARKYALDPSQQAHLREWLNQNATLQAQAFSDLSSRPGTRLEDLALAATRVKIDDGLDAYMEARLGGEKLKTYRSDRLREKIESVQQEADRKVERLHSIVTLDETQRGQVFGIMARGAKDYEPSMQLEGAGTSAPVAQVAKQEAILSILRSDQVEAYQQEKEKRRASTQKDLESIGLTLPPDWQDNDFLDP